MRKDSMCINEIEAWAREYRKTHTYTELISVAIRLNKGNSENLTELQLAVSKRSKPSNFEWDSSFDTVVLNRCRDAIVYQIEKYTHCMPEDLGLQDADFCDYCLTIINKLCNGSNCPYKKSTLYKRYIYWYSDQVKLIFFFTGVALSSQLDDKDAASILLSLAERLLYNHGMFFTLDQDAYLSICPRVRHEEDYIVDGKNFFGGAAPTL